MRLKLSLIRKKFISSKKPKIRGVMFQEQCKSCSFNFNETCNGNNCPTCKCRDNDNVCACCGKPTFAELFVKKCRYFIEKKDDSVIIDDWKN